MTTCSVNECENPLKARGFCMSHYRKAMRSGQFTPRAISKRGATLEDRLRSIGWDEMPSGCWGWKGAVLNGYGRVGKSAEVGEVLAHRVSYAAFIGPIPDGMFIHHKCANRRCINPEHLELTTERDNMAEMMERNFYIRRIAELEAEVRELRKLQS